MIIVNYLDQIELYSELAPKHQKFIMFYVNDPERTAYKAVTKAGYATQNPRQRAAVLMKDENIKQVIYEYEMLIAADHSEVRDQVIKELCLIAFCDMKEFIKWTESNGLDITKLDKLPENLSRVVKEVSITETKVGTNKKFKLHDKIAAIQELNKMLGFYSADKIAVTNPDGNMGQSTIVMLPSNGREKK